MNTHDDADDTARAVFAGLTPTASQERIAREHGSREHASREHSRLVRGAFVTGSVLLAGSMAAMTLTGPVDPVEARTTPKAKGSSELGAVREAPKPSSVAVSAPVAISSAPAVYRVAVGDTVSSIAGQFGLSTASVLALNGLGWSSLIFPGQELRLAPSGAAAQPVTQEVVAEVVAQPAAPETATDGSYSIVVGDTIGAIAARFGISTISLLGANGLGWSSIIYPGQTLVIPGQLADVARVDVARVDVAPTAESSSDSPTPSSTYTIVSGDTVSALASRFGVSIQALLDANGLDSSGVIFAGSTLSIPAVGAQPAPVSAAVSPASVAPASGSTLTSEMRSNATVIVEVGRSLGVSDYGIVIALATAMQESSLRNLDWGDLDSVGLFQQRPSAGWGSVRQLTDPEHAARLFYGGASNPNLGKTRGLLDISGWESMPLTIAAQKVQISAHPDAYAKWESSAREWLAELG